MRIALGVAWLVVVAAEMIAVNSGLGFLIVDARNAGNRYDLVVAGMVLIGSIGLVLDLLMRRLERLDSVRWGYASRMKVQFSDVSMRFGAMEVLQHITLGAEEGEFVCILGPSGCGKSTLLNIAGGFLAPTQRRR